MKNRGILGLALAGVWLALGASAAPAAGPKTMKSENPTEVAVLGGGCFWCIEAVFQLLPGVQSIQSGYAGGHVANPTYEAVCSGQTGHAEVIRVEFNPAKVSYEKILETFWEAHDPTTLNRQGNDVGTQYRSVIFYTSEAQRQAAEKSKRGAQGRWDRPVVTEIVPLQQFHPAERHHQNYYRNNPEQPYCRVVIQPKVEKWRKKLAR